MTTEERWAILDRAITTYGAPAQMDMAVEEMAELNQSPLQGEARELRRRGQGRARERGRGAG